MSYINFKIIKANFEPWDEFISELKSSMRVQVIPLENGEYLVHGYWIPNPTFRAEKRVTGLDQISAAILDLKNMILEQKPLKQSFVLTRSSKIVKEKGGYSVKSEKGKHLGGPYKTKEQAIKRLRQVEFFKHRSKK